jgi:hypothetical protein
VYNCYHGSHLATICTVSQLADLLCFLHEYQLKIKDTFVQESRNLVLAGTMSLGLLQLDENYRRFLMDFNDDERELIMIIANMKYGTMGGVRGPHMILADGKSNCVTKIPHF